MSADHPENRGVNFLIPVLTPVGRDAELVCTLLQNEGLHCESCETLEELMRQITDETCGPAVIADQAVSADDVSKLLNVLDEQAAWSDLPLIIFTPRTRQRSGIERLASRRNAMLLKRPVDVPTFLSVFHAALEARRRQFQVRDLLINLEKLNHRLENRAAQLQKLALQLTHAEHRERRRLSRILHDHLQQLLVGAKFHVTALSKRAADELQVILRQVEELLDESVKVSRSLAAELSPPFLNEADLRDSLQWLARRMAKEQGLTVDLHIAQDAGPVCDEIKLLLFDAARELLFNVVKHAGVRSTRLELLPWGESGIALVVEDRGRGISPSQLGHDSASISGIGLLTLRERVDCLGGSLNVRSRAGEGSRIEIRVPREAVASAATERKSAEQRTDSVTGGYVPGAERIRVLLVDDHTVLRRGLTALLEDAPDIEVVGEAATGRQAIEQARELRPDAIVMDITMPEMNGIVATRQIVEEQTCPHIIGLSMHDQSEMARQMLQAGAKVYLTKGGPIEELIAAIRDSLART